MYIIDTDDNNLEEFYQRTPNFICQNAGVCKAMGRKCRDPRCSMDCRNNWASKESAILREYLRNWRADGTRVFRGNLTLPINATEDDHKRARSRFMSALNAWKRVKGITFSIRCYLHLTARGGHYDFIGYTDSPFGSRTLSEQVADLWRGAGGMRSSLQIVEEDEFQKRSDGIIKYVVKDLKRVRERKEFVYLPRRQGLSLTFGTRGFFAERASKELWKDLIEEWFKPKRYPIPVAEYERMQEEQNNVANNNKENNTSEQTTIEPYIPPRWGGGTSGQLIKAWWRDDNGKREAYDWLSERLTMKGIAEPHQVIEQKMRLGTHGEGVDFGIICFQSG